MLKAKDEVADGRLLGSKSRFDPIEGDIDHVDEVAFIGLIFRIIGIEAERQIVDQHKDDQTRTTITHIQQNRLGGVAEIVPSLQFNRHWIRRRISEERKRRFGAFGVLIERHHGDDLTLRFRFSRIPGAAEPDRLTSEESAVVENPSLLVQVESVIEFDFYRVIGQVGHITPADVIAVEAGCVEVICGWQDGCQIDVCWDITCSGRRCGDEWNQNGTEQYECRDHANRERCSTHAANSPTINSNPKTSESAHFFEGDHDGGRESLGVRLHRVADRRKQGGIFFEIGRALRHRWLRAIDHRRPGENHHVIAIVGGVEVECDARIGGHVPGLCLLHAVDDDLVRAIPDEPDWIRLRCAVGANRRQPRNRFRHQALSCARLKRIRRIE
ncbi:MAG: hypothetical protein R2845_07420 [Thermomicrobiales bacterium]